MNRRNHLELRRRVRLGLPLVVLGISVVCAVFGPDMAPYNPLKVGVGPDLAGPSWHHLIGTDAFGRDLLSRLIVGSRPSIEVGFGAASVAFIIGTVLGIIAGYTGGLMEWIVLRLNDVVMSFPAIAVALLLVVLVGPGAGSLIIIIGLLFFPLFARIAYGEARALRDREFVQASESLGAGRVRLMALDIFPNTLPPLIVQYALAMAAAVLLESGLDYLGLGIVPPAPSWGGMIADSQPYIFRDPLYMLWPTLALLATVMALNSIGDQARDWLDVRQRSGKRGKRLGSGRQSREVV